MNPKFLLIDDDQDVLSVLSSILQSLGCETQLAQGGAEGLAILKDPQSARAFDAIFLDIMMPEVNGFNVLEQLRQMPHGVELPVVLLTSLSDGEKIIKGYQSGATYYITKPFTREQVVYGLDMLFAEEAAPEGAEAPAVVHELDEV